MSTPGNRARRLRAALVGVCSAAMTVAAHTAAGGTLPPGGALALALVVCAAVAAMSGGPRFQGSWAVVGALGLAQALGHLTLVGAAGMHHHPGGLGVTPTMLASHAAATVVLGTAIACVEHLYKVGSSVLCWLRLIDVPAQRATPRPWRGLPDDAPVRSVLRCAGLGMRAPPAIPV